MYLRFITLIFLCFLGLQAKAASKAKDSKLKSLKTDEPAATSSMSVEDLKSRLESLRDIFSQCLVNKQVGLQAVFNESVSQCEEQIKKKFPDMPRYQIVMNDPYKEKGSGKSMGGIYHKSGNFITVEIHVELHQLQGRGKDQKLVVLEKTKSQIHMFNVKADDDMCEHCETFKKKSTFEDAKNAGKEILSHVQKLQHEESMQRERCEDDMEVLGWRKKAEGCEKFCKPGEVELAKEGTCRSCEKEYLNSSAYVIDKYLGKKSKINFSSIANTCVDQDGCKPAEKWDVKTQKCEYDCGIGSYMNQETGRCVRTKDICMAHLNFYKNTTTFNRHPFLDKLEAKGCDIDGINSAARRNYESAIKKMEAFCNDESAGDNDFSVYSTRYEVTQYMNACAKFLTNNEVEEIMHSLVDEFGRGGKMFTYPQVYSPVYTYW